MLPVLQSKNEKLIIKQFPLISNRDEDTILSADVDSASGTITVKNIEGFSTDQVLLIGELGSEGSEIIKTHASTVPSGTTITLASNTLRAHSAGTKVYLLQYDQVELSHATTSTGSKTLLTTTLGSGLVALEADDDNVVYDETEFSSGFYFARFKNSISAAFSGHTDATPFGSWDTNQVGHLIQYALNRNETNFTNVVDRVFCYEEINACLKKVQGKQIRWDKHQNLNAIIDQTVRGIFEYDLPSDIYDNDSNKSILAVRIGDGRNLIYKDPIEFEDEPMQGVNVTQVRTEASVADTTLKVDNSYDFGDTGTLTFFISGTKYTITYSGVTRDDSSGGTAVFTGIPASGDNSIQVTVPVDTNIWEGQDEGEVVFFTVVQGKIRLWPIPDSQFDNMNIYMDYWTVATEVDSDGDVIDLDRFDMVRDWLTWKIKMQLENGGKLSYEDGYYISFKESLNDSIRTKGRGFKHKYKPKINKISYGTIKRPLRRRQSSSS